MHPEPHVPLDRAAHSASDSDSPAPGVRGKLAAPRGASRRFARARASDPSRGYGFRRALLASFCSHVLLFGMVAAGERLFRSPTAQASGARNLRSSAPAPWIPYSVARAESPFPESTPERLDFEPTPEPALEPEESVDLAGSLTTDRSDEDAILELPRPSGVLPLEVLAWVEPARASEGEGVLAEEAPEGARPTREPDSSPPPPAPAESDRANAVPMPVHTPPPRYPRLSLRAGEEGVVSCRLTLSPEGEVLRVEVERSSGFERLDNAARTALLKWRFQPLGKGQTDPVELLHSVTFLLEAPR